jgi:hypothetical protein
MELENLLVKIAEILERLKIPYAVTGGMAVTIWGRPRYTADIDVIAEILHKDIKILAKALLAVDKDVYVSEEAMVEALDTQGEFNFIHPQSGAKADFWVVKDAFQKSKIKRAVPKIINGQKVFFVSPEDLILSKLQWFKLSPSYRHIDDIKSVIAISGKTLDKEYITNWIKKLDLTNVVEENKIEIK